MKETITITGGGLTGLSLAIALRRNGVNVALHEAGSYPRHRVCGEFISGVTHETLQTLGIVEAMVDSKLHRHVAWFSGNDFLRENILPFPAIAISRYLLDDRLQKHAAILGVEMHIGSRRQMQIDTPGEVWAAGRKPAKGGWIGLKAHVRGLGTKASLEMHSGPKGYLGVTEVEDGWHNVCGLFRVDKSFTARHAGLLPAYLIANGNTLLAKRLSEAEWRDDSFTAVAGFALGLQKPTSGVLCLGDSHSIIPPFTGNGMTMAFESAEIALQPLLAYVSGELTWQKACDQINLGLEKRFSKRLTSAKFLHPLLFQGFAKPLLKHIPIRPILSLIR